MATEVVVAGKASSHREFARVKVLALNTLSFLAKKGHLEVVFLGNRAMKSLKKRELPREKGPANVLAFPDPPAFPWPSGSAKPLGVVYLNRDMVKGKARALDVLFIHGLLHLLGYDHKRKGDILKMEKLESELIQKFARS